MRIEYLADYTEHIPTLAKWFHDQWGYLSPDRTLEEQTERVRMKANRETIPVACVAMDGDAPIGSASPHSVRMKVSSSTRGSLRQTLFPCSTTAGAR